MKSDVRASVRKPAMREAIGKLMAEIMAGNPSQAALDTRDIINKCEGACDAAGIETALSAYAAGGAAKQD